MSHPLLPQLLVQPPSPSQPQKHRLSSEPCLSSELSSRQLGHHLSADATYILMKLKEVKSPSSCRRSPTSESP